MRHSTLLAEFNDISQRLEYLVAHSSQMIFVTGEDMAIQRGFVEAFLGQQSQTANVAFLVARKGKSHSYYREQLSEQLYFANESVKKPLVQTFTSRKNKEAPVLVAITNAEYLSEETLRELWDLVLQNRFARNAEQINILLFGEQNWAEEVKSWLPTNNNDKPVLLTTQTLEYEEEHEIEGDLDALINSRRQLFQERMKARSQNYKVSTPVLKTWWIRLLAIAGFVTFFSGILIWQYFDVTANAAREFAQFLFQADVTTESQQISPQSNQSESNVESDREQQLLAALSAGVDSTEQSEQEAEAKERIPLTINEDNIRAAKTFQSAMERLTSRQPDMSVSEQAESFATDVDPYASPSAEQPESEYVVDFSPEQLKQLRNMQSSSDPQNVENNSEHQDLAASDAQTEQAAAVTSGSQVENARNAQLNAAISAALLEMDRISAEPVVEDTTQVSQLSTSNVDPDPQAQTIPVEVANDNSESLELSVVEPNTTELNAAEAQSIYDDFTTGEGAVEDYQIADIVDESQVLDAIASENDNPNEGVVELSQLPPEAEYVESEPFSSEATAPNLVQSDEGIVISSDSEQTAVNFLFDEQSLMSQEGDSFVLQLAGISSLSLLNDYIRDNGLTDNTWIYQTERYGGDWFVVLLNQSFSSLDAARDATAQANQILPSAQPFAKAVSQVQQEIQAFSGN